MRPIHISLALLGSALMLACSDRAPLPLAAGPGPAFDFTNGPESPGESGILRFGDLWIEGIADPAAGYRSIHGLAGSVDAFCNDFMSGLNEVSFQVQTLHADEVQALLVEREQPVQVFTFVPGGLCAVLRNVQPIARGTVRWRRTDNNLTETGTEGGRANVFGQRAEGIIDATGGGRVHYMAEILLLIDPKTEELVIKTRKILLTPIR